LYIKSKTKLALGLKCDAIAYVIVVVTSQPCSPQTTVCLLQRESFTYPVCLMDLIIKLQLYCLDIVGLRLSFVTNGTVQKNIR